MDQVAFRVPLFDVSQKPVRGNAKRHEDVHVTKDNSCAYEKHQDHEVGQRKNDKGQLVIHSLG